LPRLDNTDLEANDSRHLGTHATAFFPPTLAILGGCLAQDVLRAISKKDKPIANLLAVDSWTGQGAVARWGMDDMLDA
jgi:ubiquitin-like 1-activating enzyme E1 A